MPKKLNLGTTIQSIPDDRNGLGYGVLKPSGRFEPRQSGNFFPYREEEEIDPIDLDSESDIEIYNRLSNKMLAYIGKTDSMAGAGTNPFTFVGGNTKLSESPVPGMVPFPNMYKKAVWGASASPVSFQGPSSGYHTNAKTFGSKKGYSKAIMTDTQKEFPKEIESYEELISRDFEDFDEKHVEMLKNKIKSILFQN